MSTEDISASSLTSLPLPSSELKLSLLYSVLNPYLSLSILPTASSFSLPVTPLSLLRFLHLPHIFLSLLFTPALVSYITLCPFSLSFLLSSFHCSHCLSIFLSIFNMTFFFLNLILHLFSSSTLFLVSLFSCQPLPISLSFFSFHRSFSPKFFSSFPLAYPPPLLA